MCHCNDTGLIVGGGERVRLEVEGEGGRSEELLVGCYIFLLWEDLTWPACECHCLHTQHSDTMPSATHL